MNKERMIDARFLNSIITGLADVLFKWDGGVYTVLGYNVGREMLDFIGKDLDLETGSTDDILEVLGRQLVETYRLADSMSVSRNEEKECIEVRIENCVLLPFAKKEAKRNPFFMRIPLCPIKNMIMGILEKRGDNTEVRTFDIQGERCQVVIGLIEELPMERELRLMGTKK